MRQGLFFLLILIGTSVLSGCAATLWSGASMVYDRHGVYKKVNNYELLKNLNDLLAVNRTFNNSSCVLDLAVFNGDVLVAGHVPTTELSDDLKQRLKTLQGYRRLFNEVKILQISSNSIGDSWITTKIRSQIFADESIDPNAFKIVTSDKVVYLMGDVKPDQADKVVAIARSTEGVERVVKLMQYFTYQSSKNVA